MPATLPTRNIAGTPVTAIGYGSMSLATAYGAVPPLEERLNFLDAVYETGCTFWDTADAYKDSEDVIGAWFKRSGLRKHIFIATKFGFVRQENKLIDGSPEYVKVACEKSLKRLGIDQIDLYYLHRPDPTVPIEKTVGAMAELVKEGKVKYIGLSECSAQTIRRAHAVHPIAAVQVEYSPFVLDIESIGVKDTCEELGIAIVAYSPLGRGLLTGQYKSPDDFAKDDFRHTLPRYSRENFPKILKLTDGLKKIADKHSVTPGQVALAWLLAQGDNIIPIPGTKRIECVKENLGGVNVKLSPEEVAEIRDMADKADAINGARYGGPLADYCFVDTPEL